MNPIPKSFDDVLAEEQASIRLRRRLLNQVPEHEADPAGEVDDAFGIALSGGGIRSASFNLGLLQAFAEQRLLSNADYLSTVSGGGYIGSWLAAWIKRDGDIRNVEQQLMTDRDDQAQGRPQLAPGVPACPVEEEPEPVRHVRANSNFLAPRSGLFTPDSWTLIAIYIRNVFLNSLVLLPTVVACIFAAMWWASLHFRGNAEAMLNPSWIDRASWQLPVVVAAVLLFVGGRLFFLEMQKARNLAAGDATVRFKKVDTFLVLSAVIICACLALDIGRHDSWIGQLLQRFPWYTVPLAAALIHAMFNLRALWALIRLRDLGDNSRWIVSGLVAGFVEGVLLWNIAGLPFSDVSLFGVPIPGAVLKAMFLTPLLVLGFFLGESIQLGVLGLLEHRLVRERWSAFLARCLMIATAWLVISAHIFLATPLFLNASEAWVKLVAAISWAVSALGSIGIARGQNTGDSERNGSSWFNLISQAAPPIFLSGLLAGLSALVYMLWGGAGTGWAPLLEQRSLAYLGLTLLFLGFAFGAGLIVDINIFSLQEMYQNRLVRCFLGASRLKSEPIGASFRSRFLKERTPDPLTGIDPFDDLPLAGLQIAAKPRNGENSLDGYNGPVHLINAAINLNRDIELERQERKANSFVFSPHYCGSTSTDYRPTGRTLVQGGQGAPADWIDGFGRNMTLGDAMAISGAAFSPNMGYYSSAPVTALLTLLNLRLGAWRGNPQGTQWHRFGPRMGWLHLFKEMLGLSDSDSDYIYLSDGGHFDNLGVYELLRRRCKYIIACDAGADPTGTCTELAMLIRKARVDFGIHIEIDTSALVPNATTKLARDHVAVGEIRYPAIGDEPAGVGYLFYVKMTMRGDEPADILSYRNNHPDFPHRTTLDQFFSESQFESFRHLGYFIGAQAFHGGEDFRRGHPRRAPDARGRTLSAFKEYMDAILAKHQVVHPPNWIELNNALDIRYAELCKSVAEQEHLQKLFDELCSLSSCLDAAEERKFAPRDEPIYPATYDYHLTRLRPLWNATRQPAEARAERGWMIEAATLLSQVVGHLNLAPYSSVRSLEWARVLRLWCLTSVFDDHWKIIKSEFPLYFVEFVDDLRNDSTWIDLDDLR